MTELEAVLWFLGFIWLLLIVALIVGIVVEKGRPTHRRNTTGHAWRWHYYEKEEEQ